MVESKERCIFATREVMFTDVEHKFVDHEHIFKGVEHKFSEHEYKIYRIEKKKSRIIIKKQNRYGKFRITGTSGGDE